MESLGRQAATAILHRHREIIAYSCQKFQRAHYLGKLVNTFNLLGNSYLLGEYSAEFSTELWITFARGYPHLWEASQWAGEDGWGDGIIFPPQWKASCGISKILVIFG
jgi:hypothetical protein